MKTKNKLTHLAGIWVGDTFYAFPVPLKLEYSTPIVLQFSATLEKKAKKRKTA